MKKRIVYVFLFVFIFLCFNIPSFATFQINNFNIDAKLLPNGDMEVAEKIDYYTDETVNGLIRDIEAVNEENDINSANGIKLESVKVDGMEYECVPYANKGNTGVYTATNNPKSNKITVYTPFTSNTKTVEYKYLLTNVAVRYTDTAELFWNFLGSEWDCYIGTLIVNIELPEEAGNDTIWVYGHGSDTGRFNKNLNKITLNVSQIPAYNAIDARILFSRNSISDCTKVVNREVLANYIDKEEGMAKELEIKKVMFGLTVNQVALGLGTIILFIMIGIYILFDKEVNVESPKYIREMPYNLEPEVLQYIYYGKTVSNSFYIAVLNLIKLGVYKLEDCVNEFGKETQRLVFNKDNKKELKTYQMQIISTVNGFLEDDEKGRASIDMKTLSKKMSNSVGSGFKTFQNAMKKEKDALVGKPEKAPTKIIVAVIILAVAVIAFISLIASVACGPDEGVALACILGITATVYSVFLAVIGSSFFAAIFILFHASCFQVAIFIMMKDLGILAFYPVYLMVFASIQYVIRIKKYPKKERQIIAYVKGLKRYIKDYSMLSEKEDVNENIALWEDYFIMAIALNLNKKTINYFYDFGKEQNTNLGTSMRYTNSYTSFHHDMYHSFYTYQKSYAASQRQSSFSSYSGSGFSSSGSSHSGSSGGFSGGHSSGGHGGGGGGGSRF